MTSRPSLPARPARALLAALAALAALGGALLAGAAAPAAAHEGAGVVTVEAAHPAGTSVHYIVRVTWQDDGHPAADATVTATPVGADGTALTPTTLAPSGGDDGRYDGVVEFPEAGAYTVRFTSIDPTGTAERAEEVTAPEAPTAADEPTAGTEGGFAPADDGTGRSTEEESAVDEGGDGIPVLLVVAAAVFALGGVVTALFLIRRYRPELQGGTGRPGGPSAGPGATDTGEPGATDTGRPGDTDTGGDRSDAGPDAGTTRGGPDARAGGRSGEA